MLPLRDENPTTHFPFVTVAIIALNVLAFLLWEPTFASSQERQQTFFFCHGLIPYEAIHHVNLAVSDPLASADWYGRVLGYRKVREFVSDGEITGVALNHPDGGVRLVLRRSNDVRSGPSLAPIAYSVPSTGDLHALMARISPDDLRGRVFEPATSGALLSFTDPDGHRINIYSIEQS